MERMLHVLRLVTPRWALLIGVVLTGSLVLAATDLDKMQSIALSRYGQDTANTVAEWRAMIDKVQPLTEQQKIVAVNDFFNTRIRWVPDTEAWDQKDYWATPLETMGKRMGDCEDFAIAKYATLLLAGVDVNKLRITYVKARICLLYTSDAADDN